MSVLVRSDDPNLLVGPETSDDGGVYQITPDIALVESCDVITPPADDPYTFGKIAATNALSDIYAMGGKPTTAMNLVFYPACSLPPEVLAEILAGGQAALLEANCCLVGGHTVEDDELKFGLSVTGIVHPSAITRNSTALPGDQLILTKPVGNGIIATAVKGEMATTGQEADAVKWMTLSNRKAAELMLQHKPSACTDITGFGLIGHCCEMAHGSNLSIRLHHNEIPLMQGVDSLIADGMVPAGCYRNRDCYLAEVENCLQNDDLLLPFFDPQTSGGLLISLPPANAQAFLDGAAANGIFARKIGAVTDRQKKLLQII